MMMPDRQTFALAAALIIGGWLTMYTIVRILDAVGLLG